MKRYIILVMLSIISFGSIHAEVSWTLSDDGTLTISGTDMPDFSDISDDDFFLDVPWFYQREKIKKVVIQNGVTKIGNCAFYDCRSLTSITIPNSVTNIGRDAFKNCSGLTSITIPNSVTSIGSDAFYGCRSLTSITIPNSVTNIGRDAFSWTKWYDDQPNGLVYAGLVLYKYKGTMPANTNIMVKNGTKGIGGGAFSYCSRLTSITIPNSVTSIGDHAFQDCLSLTSITIPNSVTSIGNGAFYDCRSLTSITIPNSVTRIGDGAFSIVYLETSKQL